MRLENSTHAIISTAVQSAGWSTGGKTTKMCAKWKSIQSISAYADIASIHIVPPETGQENIIQGNVALVSFATSSVWIKITDIHPPITSGEKSVMHRGSTEDSRAIVLPKLPSHWSSEVWPLMLIELVMWTMPHEADVLLRNVEVLFPLALSGIVRGQTLARLRAKVHPAEHESSLIFLIDQAA